MRGSLVLLALVLAACGEPTIICDTDENCPTGWFCDVVGECRKQSATLSPADVELDGVALSDTGPFAMTVSLPEVTSSTSFGTNLYASITNRGSEQAEQATVTMTASVCPGFFGTSSQNPAGANLDGGASQVISIAGKPGASCPAMFEVDVAIDVPYRGTDGSQQHRTSSGSFVVDVTP